MGWTNWRLLADRRNWYDDVFDHDGAACYELAIAGPRGGDLRIVYCGHTSNERQRMTSYGRDGSHLASIIEKHLRQGWCLYYRAWACRNEVEAEKMERRMLAQYDYDWNLQLNS